MKLKTLKERAKQYRHFKYFFPDDKTTFKEFVEQQNYLDTLDDEELAALEEADKAVEEIEQQKIIIDLSKE